MREIIVSRPTAIVTRALRSGLGKLWGIIIVTDDALGVTFQISETNIEKYRVKACLTRWAGKDWIRAGIVEKFMATNGELTARLKRMFQSHSRKGQ